MQTIEMTKDAPQTSLRVELREYPRATKQFPRHTNINISEGEVHVWYAAPSLHFSDIDPVAILSEDECARMARFRFDADQKNFLFCRSMLRMLLSSYVGASPAELSFAYSKYGKPSLTEPPGDLRFNLSHTSGLVLLAVCRGKNIGVDIERVRKDLNVKEISGRFFSAAEHGALLRMPEKLSHQAFFGCWTRKEAFVKARGEGLSCPLESFDVSVAPEVEDVTLITRPDVHEAGKWHLQSLNFFPEYAAALAIERPHKGELQF
jgi:4'-phosphopantetheinyl transferase